MCENVFSDKDIFNEGELTFCEDDLEIFNNNNWIVIKSARSTNERPSDALKIYQLKHELSNSGNKCFIKTSYDYIDTEVVSTFELFSIKKGS